MIGCLDGVRVLELARFQAGPRAGMLLSDLGAEVIKIEPLGGEATRKSLPIVNGQSVYFGTYNRGKKSLCLDMRKDEGKRVFRELLAKADMVLENFRPGIMEEMGLSYEDLCKVKPDIIMLRASAFGQTGPYRDRPGFDTVGQAMSGLMMLTGQDEGKPIGTAFSLMDRATALHCTIGALGALRHRDRTGEGQMVDVCLMDAALSMVEIPTSYYLSTGKEGGEGGRAPYKAKDGWVIVVGATAEMFRKLCDRIGYTPDPGVDPLAMIQSTKHPVRNALGPWCEAHTVTEILAAMEELGIVAAPVLTTPQVAKDPHLWAREMLVKTEDPVAGELYLPGLTIKFSKTPGKTGRIPEAGEHTQEILQQLLGYEDAAIARLREQHVVGG